MHKEYDVIIVGGGPAGIFAALELSQNSGASILLLDKGKDIARRRCPIAGKDISCISCHPCDMVSGWGGAGAFSDGKLTLSPGIGGKLTDYFGEDNVSALIDYADSLYLKFGAPNVVHGTGEEVAALVEKATRADLRLIPMKVRHVGTEKCREVLQGMHDYLAPRVDMVNGKAAASILVEDGKVKGIRTEDGQDILCRYLVIAPGREGADWLSKEAGRLGLTMHQNPVDLGVRVELPAPVLKELTDALYESKIEFYSKTFDDRIRTFCMCPAGEVTMESTGGDDPVTTVNGHSYHNRKTPNTNFALLVSTTFTEPFREPIAYGKYIARLANILSGGVIVQRLGDLLAGRRSTPERIQHSMVRPTLLSATPGDLSFVLPYRYLKGIMEMLEALDKLAPGVASRHTLLYGVEVKFYSSRLELSKTLETQITNMFATGDGAGVTRGLIQASASGVAVAREILQRIKAEPLPIHPGHSLPGK